MRIVDEDALVQDYKDEMLVSDLLKKYQICRYTLYQILDEHHVKRRIPKRINHNERISRNKEKALLSLDVIHNHLLKNEVYELMDCVYAIYNYIDN